jgi:hypothetical protein
MIPVVKKEPPADLEPFKEAIRSRMAFTIPDVDASGRYSVYRRASFFVQYAGKLVALYDPDAERWFVCSRNNELGYLWAAQLVLDAVGADNCLIVDIKRLRAIQRNGFLSVVRSRLNVAKEK